MTAHQLPSTYLKPPAGDAVDLFEPSYLDDIANAIRGPAVEAAIDARIEQILRFGHDSERDSMLPIGELPQLARKHVSEAIERISATGEKRHLPGARKSLARAAALCLAAIDRLGLATAAEAKQQGLKL